MNFDTIVGEQNISILRVKGKIIGNAADEFRAEMEQHLQGGNDKLIVDLMNVPLIDSNALGAIILNLQVFQKAGGKLVLLNPQKVVRETLEVTQLTSVLEIYDTEESARSAFS